MSITRKTEKLYRKTISKYGQRFQILKAIEEHLELVIELVRFLVGKGDRGHIIEELNDAMITTEQLLLIFDVQRKELSDEREMKLNRLEERLNDE